MSRLRGFFGLGCGENGLIGDYRAYTSVESCVREGGEIDWIMATASDSKGVLPMWTQKMALPGAISKDVGLFVKWCEEERKKKTEGK